MPVRKEHKRGFYPTYLFKEHDPVLDLIDTAVQDVGFNFKKLSEISGVSQSTLINWRLRRTKRPQFATVQAVAHALGRDFTMTQYEGKSLPRTLPLKRLPQTTLLRLPPLKKAAAKSKRSK